MKTVRYVLLIEYKNPPTEKENFSIKQSLKRMILGGAPNPKHILHRKNIDSINIFKEKEK